MTCDQFRGLVNASGPLGLPDDVFQHACKHQHECLYCQEWFMKKFILAGAKGHKLKPHQERALDEKMARIWNIRP